MKKNSPTHEQVTQRAHEIWKARGGPEGCDTEIWLEAEWQLSVGAPEKNVPSDAQGRGNGNSQRSTGADGNATDPRPEHPLEHAISTHSPGEMTAKANQQKKAARAPKLPGKTAPKVAPVESGKPLWDKPHSS